MHRTRRLAVLTASLAGALVGILPAAAAPPVTVHFRGEAGAAWAVEPRSASVKVMRGEIFQTAVRVHNRSADEVVAMVVKEIHPAPAAGAVVHLGCGPTFTLVLRPGEATSVQASYFVAEDTALQVGTFEIAYLVYSFERHSPDPLQLGRRTYAERCVSCHGFEGRGDGPTARLLKGGVSDLGAAIRAKADDALRESIAQGTGPMPAFAPALSDAEQRALVVYLRDLVRGAP